MNPIDTKTFFSLVWPVNIFTHEMLELRAINRKTGKIQRGFFASLEDFLAEMKNFGDGWDLYFGVSTRFEEGGKKKDCYRVKSVWIDLDKPKLPTMEPAPNVIVNSGSGFHVYWTLKEPVFIRSGRWAEIEAINRALCKKFHGDIGSIDVSRILRIPGTLNWKYNPPRKVKAFDNAISD